MKKVLMLTALVVLFAVPAMAAIKTTRHNLGTTGDYTYKSTNETEICVFCHTPHNASQNIPLWNRTNPAGPFNLYTASPTLNINANGKGALESASISAFCLSCHDGVTGLGAGVENTPNGVINFAGDNININSGSKARLGTNLTNDHPVNFSYDQVMGIDGTIVNPAPGSATGVRFFKATGAKVGTNFVECASCHDVHGTAGFKKFLRRSNASSGLCLTCHNK